jgi:hypothetical protein
MADNLVLLRAGASSLHPCWIDRGKPRDWDLRLVPYQDVEARPGVDCVIGDVVVGPKWSGIREALAGWDGWRDYEYVWMPDDDIFASQETISRMFAVAREAKLDLFAPALHEASYYAHFDTMRSHGFFGRRTGFVEIMVPCFSREALEQLLPTLELSTTGWGWGLDSLWPKRLGYKDLGIIDGVPVLHTRPVGQFRDADLARRVNEESDCILRDNECGQQMVTFAGINSDLQTLQLNPDELLLSLAQGWQYLLQRDPKVLRWMVEHQKPFFEWTPYLVAGSPTSPS